MSGKQVKLFLVDGTPGGMTTAEITNWTGHVLAGPRSDLAQVLAREETRRTGVYLLLGDGDGLGEGQCYIGEADDVAARLRSHEKNKDFWDRVVVITSKDTNLVVGGTTATVARDVVFPSSSAAGAIVTGRSCNGRTEWRTEGGLTFGAWETRGVDDPSPGIDHIT